LRRQESEERFEDEIRRETRKEKFTFAELEGVEGEWDRLKRWYGRLQDRDLFGAPDRENAQAMLKVGEQLLKEFTRRVCERQRLAEALEEKGKLE
jgi:hypothetical protein